MSERTPAVAGAFYPADSSELEHVVTACLEGVPRLGLRPRAVVVPHAGLEYSGRCAGQVLGRLAIPPVVVMLAPNHTSRWRGPGASLWSEGSFRTPLGPVPVATAFARRLAASSDLVRDDVTAHQLEHAIEVQLPFLQVLAPGTAIVPLVVAWDDWPCTERLAAALARVIAEWPEDVLLLASSDFNHFEPATETERKDRLALERIERLDGRGLLEVCRRERITMCGRAPAAAAVEAARRAGATAAQVVEHCHSGLVTGDDQRVVGYAGILIW